MRINRKLLIELLGQVLKEEAESNGLSDIRNLSMIIDPDLNSFYVIDHDNFILDETADLLDTDLDGLLEHLMENPDVLNLREESYGLPSSAADREKHIGPSWNEFSMDPLDIKTLELYQGCILLEYRQNVLDKLIDI